MLQESNVIQKIVLHGSRSQPLKHVIYSATNHWIVKGTQQCAKPTCLGTSRYEFKARIVGLYPD